MKARITVTFEYELDPDNYPNTTDPIVMVASDVETFRENTELLGEVLAEKIVRISAEVLKE